MTKNIFDGKKTKYKDLPQFSKNAIDVYCENIQGDRLFIYSEITIDDLKSRINVPTDLIGYLSSFDEYHKWYIEGGNIPVYKDTWALIISDCEEDTIIDGWHRFHSYIEQGIKIVPCVQFV